jgi:hypothetical protein
MNKKSFILLILALLISIFATSCVGDKQVVSLEIVDGLKTEYELGETPDFSSLVIVATYNDESREEVRADRLTIGSLDTSTVGTRNLDISYRGITLTVSIKVKGAAYAPPDDSENWDYYVTGVSLPDSLALLETNKKDFLKKDAGYVVGDDNPFFFRLKLSVFSADGNKLNVIFTVKNTGKQILPYMFGWHPAFTLPGSAPIDSFYVDFGEARELSRHTLQNGPFINPFYTTYPIKDGKYYLNEEEIYANDTMIFKDAPRTVKLAGGAQKRKITLEYSDNLPYLCIWKFPDSGARYVCLEPWSDVPSDGETPENFVSRPMSRISRDESADYEYTVTFE